jgi:two-component system CheB/CheR fusion protein
LSIEIWDTGLGIPDKELKAIFEEYHQLDNVARERGRGLGLGLSIVERLGKLLGHPVRVRSRLGKGSAFTIEVSAAANANGDPPGSYASGATAQIVERTHRTGAILIVEDDPEVRELLEALLKDEGHHTITAPDGAEALDLIARGAARPDLVLADYNLPNELDGLQVIAALREKLRHEIPGVVLTGDISTETLRNIADQDCLQLNKPVKFTELARVIQRLLPKSQSIARGRVLRPAGRTPYAAGQVIFVVDDNSHIREAMRMALEESGYSVETYSTGEAFLDAYNPERMGCLLIDAHLPGMSGLELLGRLNRGDNRLSSIVITGNGDVPMAVQAMKAGALDFIEKPISPEELLASVRRAFERLADSRKVHVWKEAAGSLVANLSPRQRQIMELIVAGHPNKNIAADLGISERTVENHRAVIMQKTGSKSLAALIRLALAAVGSEGAGGIPTFHGPLVA